MNGNSQFIATYANEIIALIIIVAIAVLYLLIKSSKTNKANTQTKVEAQATEQVNDEPKSNTEDTQLPDTQEDPLVYKKIKKKREMQPQQSVSKDDFKIFQGLEIIVADDNAINQKVISSLLDGSGIKIFLANNGQEVLDLLKTQHNVSIILMDAHMPVMDGFEASKIIKQDARFDNILIIALSGDVAADDIVKMQNAGMQEHLEKPLQPGKLFELLYSFTEDSDQATDNGATTHNYINITEGAEICGGDADLYKEILYEFTQTYSKIDEKLSANLVKDQLHDTARILLDISGIAANIGADSLAAIATQYREAIKAHNELQFDALNTAFTKELHGVLDQIKNRIQIQ